MKTTRTSCQLNCAVTALPPPPLVVAVMIRDRCDEDDEEEDEFPLWDAWVTVHLWSHLIVLWLRTRHVGFVLEYKVSWELAKPQRSVLNRLFNIISIHSGHSSERSFKWPFFSLLIGTRSLRPHQYSRFSSGLLRVTGAPCHSEKCRDFRWSVHPSKQLSPDFELEETALNYSFVCCVKIQFSNIVGRCWKCRGHLFKVGFCRSAVFLHCDCAGVDLQPLVCTYVLKITKRIYTIGDMCENGLSCLSVWCKCWRVGAIHCPINLPLSDCRC